MSDSFQWSEDRCTCGHKASEHRDPEEGNWPASSLGECTACRYSHSWTAVSPLCTRYQWNGDARVRTW